MRCVDAGAAAVVVSNHGARQLADAPADGRHPGRGRRRRRRAGRGLRRRRRAARARRRQGARPGRPGRAGRAGRRCGRWPPAAPTGVAGAAALVRGRAAPGHGAVRRGDGGAARPGPGAPGPGGWALAVTTVAAMLAARAEDDRTGRAGRQRARWTLAPGGGRGRGPGRAGPLAARRRGRRTSACCCPTGPSTCSGSTARRWPAPRSSASTRPGGARPWPPTSGPPTAPSS